VPLTTFIYPIMIFIIIYSCIGLILMGPIGHPSLVIFSPCLPLTFWVVIAIAKHGLGVKITITHDYSILPLYLCS
jgi:hypothetical protein